MKLRLLLPWVLLSTLAQAQDVRSMVGQLRLHRVAAGEDLPKIALAHRIAVDHLAFANGLPITALEVAEGDSLIVPGWRVLPAHPPKNGAVVNLPERLLYLFRNGRFSGHYPVSIGDEAAEGGRFRTGIGRFSIIEKVSNPTWYPPAWAKDRRPVPPGPDNPLGERWIGLSLTRTGIHGTNDPLNVGNSVTHGCMRTHPALLRELYDRVQVGWEVRIEYEVSKLGRDAQGRRYLVNFPDIYSRTPSVPRAQALLKQAGIKPKRANFNAILEMQLGVPVQVDGTGSVYEEWLLRTTAGDPGLQHQDRPQTHAPVPLARLMSRPALTNRPFAQDALRGNLSQ